MLEEEKEPVEDRASPSRGRSQSLVDQELQDSNRDEMSSEAKLERLVRMIKNVQLYSSKKLRSQNEGEKELLKQIQTYVTKVLDTEQLNKLFIEFSDLLHKLKENDLQGRIKNITATWLSCFEEDFRQAEKLLTEQMSQKQTEEIQLADAEKLGKETPQHNPLLDTELPQ